MSPSRLPAEPTVCHHAQKLVHAWLEKIPRIQAAFVNSLTMKTLPDGASVLKQALKQGV